MKTPDQGKSMRAVAWVMSPINAIQCLIACNSLGTHLGQDIDLEIIHYYPSDDDLLGKEIYTVVKDIAHSVDPDIKCSHLAHAEVVGKKALNCFPNDKPDFIFYAHDVVGTLVENLQSAFPRAKTVCYGDALGQFFKREVHLGFLIKEKGWERIKRWIFPQSGLLKKSMSPDYAVLSIPVSQSIFPKRTRLVVCDKDIVLKIIKTCANNNSSVRDCCSNMLTEASGYKNVVIFPIENMAEGKFISIEGEVDLYAEAIREHCQPGSLVFIKPHPGGKMDRLIAMQKALEPDYTIRQIGEVYKRYPIELFIPVLEKFQVISMFYPALSLSYLYDRKVTQPLTHAVIEKYFEPRLWDSYKNAVDLNDIPLRRLAGWDGKSLLYNGK